MSGQTDLCVLFAYRALMWWAKPGGRVALLLPLSVTEAAAATEFQDLLRNYRLVEVIDFETLGKPTFNGISVVACAVVIEKTPPQPGDSVRVTLVGPECLDHDTNTVDMSKAITTTLDRDVVLLGRYLPVEDGHLATTEDEDDVGTGVSSGVLLTKLKASDVAYLDALAALPRLGQIVQRGWKHRTKGRSLSTPTNLRGWTEGPIAGYGFKPSGRRPNDAGCGPIYKGEHCFPEAVTGTPVGSWDGHKMTSDAERVYGWREVMTRSRMFAFRAIFTAPTASPHPAEGWVENSAYVVELTESFPLNFYLLSNLPIWFASKTQTSGSSGRPSR